MRRKNKMTDAEMVSWLETQYDLNDNGCWVWKKSKIRNGYGQVKWGVTMISVHRLYWLLSGRIIPENLEMCHGHNCSKACFNPDHLKPGTAAENCADKIRDGTDARGEKHPSAKLTAEQVLAIRNSEKSQKELAEEYEVARETISQIINRRKWKHLT